MIVLIFIWSEVQRNDVLTYIKILRAVYIPSHGVSDMLEMHGELTLQWYRTMNFLRSLMSVIGGLGSWQRW
jgi:hypothetical protein